MDDYRSLDKAVAEFFSDYETKKRARRAAKDLQYVEHFGVGRDELLRQLYGTPSRELKGLSQLITDTGTLHGINPGASPRWDSHDTHLQLHKEYLDMIRPDAADPLDRPISLRQLIDTVAEVQQAQSNPKRTPPLKDVLKALEDKVGKTNYIGVKFGTNPRQYIYNVRGQAERQHVQVGGLVTTQQVDSWGQPQVARVTEINLPRPNISLKNAVGIAPEDARAIEASFGKVLPLPEKSRR